MKIVLVLAVACFLLGSASAETNKVVCYHGSWSTYRNGNGKFSVEDIDPTLCTHVIYTFVGLNDDGSIRIMDSWLEVDSNNFKRFTSLKNKNPQLKTLVAIGGWNEGSIRYSNVAKDANKRATLIKSALNLCQTYGFDGFDLDWEYPSQRGGAAADRKNYAILLKEFRQEWDKHGLLLTAAVAAAGNSVDLSYDVPALSKYLDIINVMAYDLHGIWDGVTGQNAPLYASSLDVSENQKQLNVDAAIKGWIARGANPQKIALGLGVYGRSFTLTNSNNNKLGAPINNGGTAGKYTMESGMLGYNEICELQKDGSWTVVWDDVQKTPYMTKGNQWVGYDDAKSIGIKVNYAKFMDLAGVMIWSIETEDFRGICGPKYPILKAINTALGTANENLPPDETNPNPEKPKPKTTTTTTTTKKPNVSPSGVCKKEGYCRDPVDCNIFYYCFDTGKTYVPIQQNCNPGLYFNEESVACDYPANVKC